MEQLSYYTLVPDEVAPYHIIFNKFNTWIRVQVSCRLFFHLFRANKILITDKYQDAYKSRDILKIHVVYNQTFLRYRIVEMFNHFKYIYCTIQRFNTMQVKQRLWWHKNNMTSYNKLGSCIHTKSKKMK